MAGQIARDVGNKAHVLIVVRDTAKDEVFAAQLRSQLEQSGLTVVGVIQAEPPAARKAIEKLVKEGVEIDVFACNRATSVWGIYERLGKDSPKIKAARVVRPEGYYWPNFLKADNLRNIANQIAVIAIIAIGMTMVIIAGGIDLSVGSLIALSAVLATRLLRDAGGGEDADNFAMTWCSLAGILVCSAAGLFSGVMVTLFRVPAFIVTLAVMLSASGFAYILSDGQSIAQVPESYVWLGRDADLLGLPNAVVLMLVLYAGAHVVMTRTTLGRYIYAVGGNAEAARLSGVPVQRVTWTVFAVSGLLAGLGGIILASQLRSGAPTYGQVYEMYVIAAVVVGGTSLSGGKGKVLGTLIGAFIIAVIQNGMNLTGVESYTQRVVLGAVILGAVVLDRIRKPASA
jgi:ribose transport system permease protein